MGMGGGGLCVYERQNIEAGEVGNQGMKMGETPF